MMGLTNEVLLHSPRATAAQGMDGMMEMGPWMLIWGIVGVLLIILLVVVIVKLLQR